MCYVVVFVYEVSAVHFQPVGKLSIITPHAYLRGLFTLNFILPCMIAQNKDELRIANAKSAATSCSCEQAARIKTSTSARVVILRLSDRRDTTIAQTVSNAYTTKLMVATCRPHKNGMEVRRKRERTRESNRRNVENDQRRFELSTTWRQAGKIKFNSSSSRNFSAGDEKKVYPQNVQRRYRSPNFLNQRQFKSKGYSK